VRDPARRGAAIMAGEVRLEKMVRESDWFMGILEAVQSVDPPDWLVGAGVIRNLVWNRLHGYPDAAHLKDVDVAFFDAGDLSPERDEAVEADLLARRPDVPWEAKNQAAVHLWYERKFGYAVPPLLSSEDGIANNPETVTSVAVRLLPDGGLYIVAPLGLDDLFGLVLRRNPRRVTRERFRERIVEKRIYERWPMVEVIRDPEPASA
jgi:hypothetical protein